MFYLEFYNLKFCVLFAVNIAENTKIRGARGALKNM
jgi:hypothetical protein